MRLRKPSRHGHLHEHRRAHSGRPNLHHPAARGGRLPARRLHHDFGEELSYNVDVDATGDLFTTDYLSRADTSDAIVRHIVREVTLGAGVHSFDLSLSGTGQTDLSIFQTVWTLHRVDGT